ncbi:hypothetical protein FACS1894166_05840 [Bacilli bacterium]|nr:hypothetical protein FACS1894166_05840 [Bacilli bacterium]
MCIQIKIGKQTKTFNDKLEAVSFIMSEGKCVSKPVSDGKPIKVTKKYTA